MPVGWGCGSRSMWSFPQRGGPEMGTSQAGVFLRPAIEDNARLVVHRVETPAAEVELVHLASPIEPLPQVAVADRGGLTVALPGPAAAPPLIEAEFNPLDHVTAGGKDSDLGGLVNRLEAAQHGQQL